MINKNSQACLTWTAHGKQLKGTLPTHLQVGQHLGGPALVHTQLKGPGHRGSLTVIAAMARCTHAAHPAKANWSNTGSSSSCACSGPWTNGSHSWPSSRPRGRYSGAVGRASKCPTHPVCPRVVLHGSAPPRLGPCFGNVGDATAKCHELSVSADVCSCLLMLMSDHHESHWVCGSVRSDL